MYPNFALRANLLRCSNLGKYWLDCGAPSGNHLDYFAPTLCGLVVLVVSSQRILAWNRDAFVQLIGMKKKICQVVETTIVRDLRRCVVLNTCTTRGVLPIFQGRFRYSTKLRVARKIILWEYLECAGSEPCYKLSWRRRRRCEWLLKLFSICGEACAVERTVKLTAICTTKLWESID